MFFSVLISISRIEKIEMKTSNTLPIEAISLATTLLLLLVEGGEIVSTFFSSTSSILRVSFFSLSSDESLSLSSVISTTSGCVSLSSSDTSATGFSSSCK